MAGADEDAVVGDTKDWTWVLREPCPECGFDAAEHPGPTVAGRTRAGAAAWQRVLERDDVRARPRPGVWSPLEYGCHVRDVFRVFDRRLDRMLSEDDPLFDNWDQDATAVEGRYGEQDPSEVGPALVAAGLVIADRFDGVPDGAWQRTGRRTDGAVFTVDSLARYFMHDWVHHLHDVGAALP